MLKKLLIMGITAFTLAITFTQSRNTLYLEAGGPGLLYSFNYEANITDKITARIGWGSLPIPSENSNELITINSIPIMGNYLLGGGNHKLVLSGGISRFSVDTITDFGGLNLVASTTATIFGGGYRYHRLTGGFFFNLSAYSINFGETIGKLPLTTGLGLGWTF